MRLTSVVVRKDSSLALERNPEPSPDWQSDHAIRWLSVENATRDELEELFDRLGADGGPLADHITGKDWMDWIEAPRFYVAVPAAPAAWMTHESWFHLVVVPGAVVCVHAVEIPELQDFVRRRWLARPAPEATIAGVLLQVIQTHAEEDGLAFYRVRLQVEEYAQLLQDEKTASVQVLEGLMTCCHHLATAHLQWELLLTSVEFARSHAVVIEGSLSLFHRGSRAVRSVREGIDHVQRRLRELLQQHLLDQQMKTDSRIRILTVISAVFLPLTLIAGIYGMNFEDMPGLGEERAYSLVLLGMVVLAGAMLGYFIRKGWFT